MNWKVEKKIIVWENFTWWYGGDKYYAPRNTYYDAYNIDTTLFKARCWRRNEKVATPESWEQIQCMAVNENWYVISILDGGKVYEYDWFSTPVLVDTLASNWYTRIATMFVWTVPYFYVFEDSFVDWIKKIQKLDTDWNFISEITYTLSWTYPFLWSRSWIVILEEKDRIIFSNHNNLYIIENTEVVQLVHSFPAWENIVGITKFQWQYSIYTNYFWKDSFKYRWSGVWWDAFTMQKQIDLHGYDLYWVINDWAYDYAIMNWTELYKFAWVQYQEIISKIWWNLIKNIWWWIYHSWDWREDKWALNRFWSEPWFKEWLHAYTYTWDWFFSELRRERDVLVYNNQDIYFALWDSIYEIRASWPQLNTTSHIISNQFVWEDIREEKTLEVVFLKFAKTDINNKIKLEVKLNDTWDWIEIYEWYNGEIEQDTYWLRIVADKFTNKLPRFNEIAFRVSFATDWATRCEFMGLRAFYNNDVWY